MFGYMKDVVFIDVSTNSWSGLEMRRSGRNEAPKIIGMAKSSKSPSFEIEEREEQVGDKLIAFQKPQGGPTSKMCSSTPPPRDNCIDRMQPSFHIDGEGQPLEEQGYVTRLWWIFGE